MNKLDQAKLFLDFYFAPWGAAKGEVWEDIFNNRPFDDTSAMEIVVGISNGSIIFSKKDIKLIRIVMEG